MYKNMKFMSVKLILACVFPRTAWCVASVMVEFKRGKYPDNKIFGLRTADCIDVV